MRVLIADDHALIRDGLAEILSHYADVEIVALAATGREAVRLALALQPDVAVLDIMMPEQNGIDATLELARRAPQVKVVMLSMHGGSQHVFQALAAGAHGYLLKQSASREIIEALRAVHAGHRYLSKEVSETVAEQLGKPQQTSPLESLSVRDRQVLQQVAEGHSSAKIAETLHLSPKTIDTYRSRLMQKLGVADVTGLVKFAILHGLTPLE